MTKKYLLLIYLILFSSISIATPPTGSSGQRPANLKPAILVQHSATALVQEIKGKKTLTLTHIHPLVGVASELQNENRIMGAFKVEEKPYSWNMCNQLKNKLNLWNKDLRNALLVYESGPDNAQDAAYMQSSPLFTAGNLANKKMKYASENGHGSLHLFLDEAKYNKEDNSYSFVIEQGNIHPGTYHNIMLLSECFFTSPTSGL